jgi:transcriptional regulator with XRE-family HTH domain
MPPVRKPLPVDHSILNEMLAIRLQQLEIENGGMEAFLPKTWLARGTYYTIVRGIGNPTLRTMERIASSLNMSVLELLGFEAADARLVIPIRAGLRSLNVAMSAAMAAGEALRQIRNPQV